MLFPTRSFCLINKTFWADKWHLCSLSPGFATRKMSLCYPEEQNLMHSTKVLAKRDVILARVRYTKSMTKIDLINLIISPLHWSYEGKVKISQSSLQPMWNNFFGHSPCFHGHWRQHTWSQGLRQNNKSFILVWVLHQPLSRSLPNGRLSQV